MTNSAQGQHRHALDALRGNRTARVALNVTAIVVGVALTTSYSGSANGTPAPASTAGNCDVTQAGEFAIQTNLRLINGATVNPGRYFTPGGSDSCISGVMLQSFDLSNLIPDFWGMVSSALENAIISGITSAVRQVCNSVNGAIQSTVGNINNAITTANNNLPGAWAYLYVNQINPTFAGTLNGNGSYGVNGNGGNNAFGITGPVTSNGGEQFFGGVSNGGNNGGGTVTIGPGNSGGGGSVIGPGNADAGNNGGGGGGGFTTGPGPSKSAVGGSISGNNASKSAYVPGVSSYSPNSTPEPSQNSGNRATNGDGSFWGRIFGQ